MARATVTYIAEMADLRKQIGSITDVTAAEAKKIVGELDKSIRALEKAQVRASKSAKTAAPSIKDTAKATNELTNASRSLAMQLPDVASQLQSGTPAFTIFAQQGLQVVQVNMALFTKTMKASAAFLSGPWGIAVAGGIAVVSILAETIQSSSMEMERFQDAISGANDALDPELIARATAEWRKFEKVISDAEVALLLETGALESLEVQQIRATEAAREAARAKLLEAGTRLAILDVQKQEVHLAIASGKLSLKEQLAAEQRVATLREEIPVAQANLDALKEEINTRVEGINATFNTIAVVKEENAELSKATKVRKGLTEEEKEAARVAREQARAIESLIAIRDGATLGVLDGEAKLTEEYRRQQAEIIRLAEVSGDTAAAQEAAVALQVQHQMRSSTRWNWPT